MDDQSYHEKSIFTNQPITSFTSGTQKLPVPPCLDPTPHQYEAIQWVVGRVKEGERLLALRGLAGTGKTTLIPFIQAELAAKASVKVGTPTHRAAMILRRKDVKDVATIHAHALKALFTPEYTEAIAWLGDEESTVAETPPLVRDRLTELDQKPEELLDAAMLYEPGMILGSIGIHGRHHLIGFGPKPPMGDVLIIDEASMVGRTLLQLCQEAFTHVLLVGDPGQLPPVQDVAVLDTVAGVQLSEIHRQAAGSPILRLAYKAREGYPFWRHGLRAYGPACREVAAVPASTFLDAPLITWRNHTRMLCTRMIREALGYPPDRLVPGEPLVCRATDRASRVDGLYNNALFRVHEVSAYDHRSVVLTDEEYANEHHVLIHIEELDGDNIELDHIPFRFGYCLTAHTAQGGEWPTVYLSQPDLVSYAGYCWHHGRLDDLARWTYTVITRARDRFMILTQHSFLKGS